MTVRCVVRRLEAHEWRAYRDLRLRALGDAPDAFGSTLEREREQSEEYWRGRLAAAVDGGLPLVAEAEGEPVGLLWAWTDPAGPGTVHITQMWVAPQRRGAGCGRRLLDAAFAWAREGGARAVELSVTRGNAAAERLYARAGFVPLGEPTPLRPGSALLSQALRLEL